MTETPGPTDVERVTDRIHTQAAAENLRITQHAPHEMVDEGITLDEILQAASAGEVLENYHAHRRGACCLVHGVSRAGRHLHIVCTAARPVLIINNGVRTQAAEVAKPHTEE